MSRAGRAAQASWSRGVPCELGPGELGPMSYAQYVIPAYVLVIGSIVAFARRAGRPRSPTRPGRPPRGQAVDLTPRTVTDLAQPAAPARPRAMGARRGPGDRARRGGGRAVPVPAQRLALLLQRRRGRPEVQLHGGAAVPPAGPGRRPRRVPAEQRRVCVHPQVQRRHGAGPLRGRRAQRSVPGRAGRGGRGEDGGRDVRGRPDPGEARQRVQGAEPRPRPRHRAG